MLTSNGLILLSRDGVGVLISQDEREAPLSLWHVVDDAVLFLDEGERPDGVAETYKTDTEKVVCSI